MNYIILAGFFVAFFIMLGIILNLYDQIKLTDRLWERAVKDIGLQLNAVYGHLKAYPIMTHTWQHYKLIPQTKNKGNKNAR